MTDTTINPISDALKIIESQLKTQEEKLASLGFELEKTARWMMEASGTPEFRNRQDVYYPQLNGWRDQKVKVNALYAQRAKLPRIGEPTSLTAAKLMEEKRAIKEATVTSTTYEKAQKRLLKQVNGFLSGR